MKLSSAGLIPASFRGQHPTPVIQLGKPPARGESRPLEENDGCQLRKEEGRERKKEQMGRRGWVTVARRRRKEMIDNVCHRWRERRRAAGQYDNSCKGLSPETGLGKEADRRTNLLWEFLNCKKNEDDDVVGV